MIELFVSIVCIQSQSVSVKHVVCHKTQTIIQILGFVEIIQL